MTTDLCTNCGSTTWAAKNKDYCTDCEREWWEALVQVVDHLGKGNPDQEIADRILEEYGIGEIPND